MSNDGEIVDDNVLHDTTHVSALHVPVYMSTVHTYMHTYTHAHNCDACTYIHVYAYYHINRKFWVKIFLF